MSVQTVETTIDTRPRPGFVLAMACAAMTIVSIDGAIVNVALASIQHDLGMDHGARCSG